MALELGWGHDAISEISGDDREISISPQATNYVSNGAVLSRLQRFELTRIAKRRVRMAPAVQLPQSICGPRLIENLRGGPIGVGKVGFTEGRALWLDTPLMHHAADTLKNIPAEVNTFRSLDLFRFRLGWAGSD
jgi:hypothetical protein